MDPILPTILVADDDAQIRAVLGRFLTQDGFNVLLAADGREALELFARTPGIAVAVIDLVMPNREGIETIQEIRRQWPRVRIVAMSGAFNGDFLPAAKLLGADATVAKPVQLSVFRDTLWAVLNERNQDAASSV